MAQAATALRADSDGEARLVAYVVARAGAVADPADLRRHLALSLPRPCCPPTGCCWTGSR